MSTQQSVFSRNCRTHNLIMYDEIISYSHQAGFSLKVILETAPRFTVIGLVIVRHGMITIAESLKRPSVKYMRVGLLVQSGPMINYCCVIRSE